MSESRTTIKLPPDLYERIRQLAERERRSMHSCMLWLLDRGLAVVDQDQEAGR
jgi:predicted transcriptional regulator